MKNQLLSTHEVESLRAQVRELRQSVADLENRLAEVESEAEDDRWGIWPYCYFLNSWNLGRDGLQSLHKKIDRWNLARRNRRYRLQNDHPVGELRLT